MTPQERPLQVTHVQGGAVGLVTEQVVCWVDIGDHHEMVTLDVVPLGKHAIILGLPWLQQHKPTISWRNGQMSFPSLYCHEMGCSSGSVKLHQKPQKDETLQVSPLHPLHNPRGEVLLETLPISLPMPLHDSRGNASRQEALPIALHDSQGTAPQREALPTRDVLQETPSIRNTVQKVLPTARRETQHEEGCESMSGSQPKWHTTYGSVLLETLPISLDDERCEPLQGSRPRPRLDA